MESILSIAAVPLPGQGRSPGSWCRSASTPSCVQRGAAVVWSEDARSSGSRAEKLAANKSGGPLIPKTQAASKEMQRRTPSLHERALLFRTELVSTNWDVRDLGEPLVLDKQGRLPSELRLVQQSCFPLIAVWRSNSSEACVLGSSGLMCRVAVSDEAEHIAQMNALEQSGRRIGLQPRPSFDENSGHALMRATNYALDGVPRMRWSRQKFENLHRESIMSPIALCT